MCDVSVSACGSLSFGFPFSKAIIMQADVCLARASNKKINISVIFPFISSLERGLSLKKQLGRKDGPAQSLCCH